MRAACAAIAVTLLCAAHAYAGKADVLNVKLTELADGRWNISVTCRHNDEGEKHFCDSWRVRTPDGGWAELRKLEHPHGMQPFTRDLDKVRLPSGTTVLIVEAHCNVHGLGGKTVKIDFGLDRGPGFEIVHRKRRTASQAESAEIARLIEQMGGGTMSDRMRARNIKDKLVRIGPAAVPQLLEAGKNHKDPWVRIWALGTLGQLHEPSAIEAMMANTTHRHATLRLVATGQLMRFVTRDERIAPVLAAKMTDTSEDVRKWAARGLARVKSRPDVVQQLEKNLACDDPDIRIENFTLLVGYSDGEPLDYIRRRIKSEAPKTRSAAYGSLGRYPPKKDQIDLYVDLFTIALDDPSVLVKREGVRGLQWVVKEGADDLSVSTHKSIGKIVDTKVAGMLDSEYDLLRGDALYLVSLRQREKLATKILERTRDESPYVRERAIRALANARQRTRGAGDAIIAALDAREKPLRETATKALVWLVGKQTAQSFKPKDGKKGKATFAEAAREWWAKNREKFPE